MDEKKRIVLIIVIGIVLSISFNWIIDLTSLDEGRNAQATKIMLSTKNFVVPYYNCKERFEKPPMLYWLGAISSYILGLNEFSLRLVSGIAGILLAICTYRIAKIVLGDDETAFRASIILMATPHFYIESRAYVPEMTLVLFMTLSLLMMLRKHYSLSWVFSAIAFLTKGPVALLSPIVYFINHRTKKLFDIKGLLLFIIIGFSWYFFMLIKFGYNYFYKFFLFEQVYRFTGIRKLQPMPFYFFFLLIIVNFIVYLPKMKEIFVKSKEKFNNENFRLIVVWALFTTLFYSLSKNKLHHYILFSYPAYSIIIANGINSKYFKRAIAVYFLLFIVFVIGATNYEKERFVPKVKEAVRNYNGNVYFYKAENSAIVFYADRCIEKIEEKKNGLIITKKKYIDNFKDCSLIKEGIEIPDKLVLLECKGGER